MSLRNSSPRMGPAGRFVGLGTVLLMAASGCTNAPSQAAGVAPAAPVSTTPATAFDADRAFALLTKQCDFGPRPVGSDAHEKTRDFLVAEMTKAADKTVTQEFTYNGMPLTNVIGIINPDAKRQILLCTHWDTRPTADMELEAQDRRKPIIGASDGASGTAVLLELARAFKEKRPDVGVILVLLDGEDYGSFEADKGVFLGSRYFAKNHKDYHPEFGILIDMVGDKNLDIKKEVNSQSYAPGTNDKVFRIAKELGYEKNLIDKLGESITDDHVPLNQAGIPTIDLIDFNYGSWHTLRDTPDKCSPKSLEIIGKLLGEVVYREKAK